MKKIFSLVLLTGMLALMSFSGSIKEHNIQPPSEELQDSCYLMASCIAMVACDDIDEQYALFGQLYDQCITQ